MESVREEALIRNARDKAADIRQRLRKGEKVEVGDGDMLVQVTNILEAVIGARGFFRDQMRLYKEEAETMTRERDEYADLYDKERAKTFQIKEIVS